MNEEDKKLLQKYLLGVKPLKANKTISVPQQQLKIPLRPKIEYKENLELSYYLSDAYTEEVESETRLSYCATNFPKKQLKLLASGKIPYQNCLDLHGETVQSAQKILPSFLESAKNKGIRSILIIHGKHSYNNKPPVLKNYINHWLKQIPLVAAFHSAIPKDGGYGAVYVYLWK